MENNIAINGDQARLLMRSLLASHKELFELYFRLSNLSQVQPPVQPQQPQPEQQEEVNPNEQE